MGLLTDPGVEKSAIPASLYSYHKILAVLFYVLGLAWFIGLSHVSLNHSTYFSENALLPGLVQGEFTGDSDAFRFLHSLEAEANSHPDSMPYAWLLGQFTQIGLDTYSHNFTLNYPMGSKVFKGKNIYGILRAVRGSSTESLVVSAPYRPPVSLHQKTSGSIALMLALAQFFSEQVYWAKDIIFLVTEHEQLGAQAWLEAYHRSSCGSGVLEAGDLPSRAGPIQAAINLEIDGSLISHIDVKIEGLNGQLPNLDLVNLIHRLCHRENVHHTFKNYDDHPNPESFKGWMHQLKTLVAMVTTQATGVPNGNHGLFHRFGIASVTVEGLKEDGRRRRRSSNLLQVGRVLEGICRSLNNLLERFHQSFFFYLLSATNRYISIGVYMPPFGLLGASLLSIALALWYSTSCAANEQHKLLSKEKSSHNVIDYSLLSKLPILMLVHCLGLLVLYCPQDMATIGTSSGISSEDSVALSLAAFSLALLFFPILTRKLTDLPRSSWEVLKCLVVLELSVVVFAGAVYNFSLSLIITLIYSPVVMVTSPSKTMVKKCIKALILLIVHPLSLITCFVFADTYINFSDLPLNVVFAKTISATKRALMYAIVDAHVYGNWIFNLGCVCIVPLWLSLWFIVFHPLNPVVTSPKEMESNVTSSNEAGSNMTLSNEAGSKMTPSKLPEAKITSSTKSEKVKIS